jgi:hypothetical protein
LIKTLDCFVTVAFFLKIYLLKTLICAGERKNGVGGLSLPRAVAPKKGGM